VLGVRLTDATERRLTDFARRAGRSKSDVTRDAVLEYLDRHERRDQWLQQIEWLARQPDPESLQLLDELAEALHDDDAVRSATE